MQPLFCALLHSPASYVAGLTVTESGGVDWRSLVAGVFGAPGIGFNRVISGFGWAEAPRLNCSHPNPNVNAQNEESFSTSVHVYDSHLL